MSSSFTCLLCILLHTLSVTNQTFPPQEHPYFCPPISVRPTNSLIFLRELFCLALTILFLLKYLERFLDGLMPFVWIVCPVLPAGTMKLKFWRNSHLLEILRKKFSYSSFLKKSFCWTS